MITDGMEDIFVGQRLVERLYLKPESITSWLAFLSCQILPLSPVLIRSIIALLRDGDNKCLGLK